MYWVGLFLAFIIGNILGLVGGGGSILTVPLISYFFNESLLLATTYSLFIVGISSGIGVLQRLKKSEIDYKKGILFVIPSMLTALAIRLWLMPLFPLRFTVHDWAVSRDLVISLLLISVMVFTGLKTWKRQEYVEEKRHVRRFEVVLYGVLTGMLSGFIGAGGGFIIVPILMRMGLEMRKAVGTSLFIITIQSFVALSGDFFNPEIIHGGINWQLLFLVSAVCMSGVLVGSYLQPIFSTQLLRRLFSILLLLLSVWLTIKLLIG